MTRQGSPIAPAFAGRSQTNATAIRTVKALRSRNWGDSIAKFIYSLLTGRSPTTIPMGSESRTLHFLTVGSVLRMCDRNSIVWGTGFLTPEDGLGVLRWGKTNNEILAIPARVCAVRGPLTRAKLLAMGVDCPEVYGDPALLIARHYRPGVRQEYKLGVIPHYTEWHSPNLDRLRRDPRVRIISVLHGRLEARLGGDRKFYRPIDEICRCEKIVSSSLHGLILADAYGIPAHRMKFSGRSDHHDFKFEDHARSVGRLDSEPIVVDPSMGFEDVLRRFGPYRINVNCDNLMASCPFMSDQ